MRALFEYEPEEDTLLPCKEIGLKFSYGDILQVNYSTRFFRLKTNISIFPIVSNPLLIHSQIINVKDPNWWQAKHIGNDEATGLIPSQELEERRKAFVPPEADYVHTISICGTRVSTSDGIIHD